MANPVNWFGQNKWMIEGTLSASTLHKSIPSRLRGLKGDLLIFAIYWYMNLPSMYPWDTKSLAKCDLHWNLGNSLFD